MNREVREQKTDIKAHLRPVEHEGRPNMGAGGWERERKTRGAVRSGACSY